MITPTPEMIEAVNQQYEPLLPTDESHRQRMPRWARALALIAVLGIIAAVISRLSR